MILETLEGVERGRSRPKLSQNLSHEMCVAERCFHDRLRTVGPHPVPVDVTSTTEGRKPNA